jgi:tRNA pseudouridine55 synthase
MDSLLLIDKPKGYSSARVVNIIKKKLNVKKAGHSGTLDPNATGLMIVCTGKKTKELNELINVGKEYEAVMVLGARTKSFDLETEVEEVASAEHLSDQDILDNARLFTGEIVQYPPIYSAVKFKGKPLYKYARKNLEVEIKPKMVTIYELEITNINKPEVWFRVSCSKGTYIRSLVNDMGEKLGVGAYLKELRRTRIGEYKVENAIKIEDIISVNNNGRQTAL